MQYTIDLETGFLNEVLSLNAQEFLDSPQAPCACSVLNEVLSLNAQECLSRDLRLLLCDSSMKS